MSRIYGAKCAETAQLDLPAVAKLIRADLKAARDDTGSPLFGLTFSVRTRHGGALDITVDGLPDNDVHQIDGDGRRVPAPRAGAVRKAIYAIADAYNWWNDEYSDVRFAPTGRPWRRSKPAAPPPEEGRCPT